MKVKYLCIKVSHISLQRGMSKLYLETNKMYTDVSYAHEVDVKKWIGRIHKT